MALRNHSTDRLKPILLGKGWSSQKKDWQAAERKNPLKNEPKNCLKVSNKGVLTHYGFLCLPLLLNQTLTHLPLLLSWLLYPIKVKPLRSHCCLFRPDRILSARCYRLDYFHRTAVTMQLTESRSKSRGTKHECKAHKRIPQLTRMKPKEKIARSRPREESNNFFQRNETTQHSTRI